jgi:hypothetical protein
VADHSEHICARIRADCEPFDFDPFNIAWKDDRLAEILAGSPSKSRGKKPLRFLQIADIHMDAEYEPGTEAKCKDRLCCPGSSSAVESSPKKIEVPAGYWGLLFWCKSSYEIGEEF